MMMMVVMTMFLHCIEITCVKEKDLARIPDCMGKERNERHPGAHHIMHTREPLP